ncbi:MAG: hypothetical protein QM773_09455 [Hyphomonadaceae bacterium]
MSLLRITLAAALAAVTLQTAGAQTPKAPSPAGSWGFKTEKMGYGCDLSGDMTITQTADKTFKCTFKAVWACQQRLPKAVHTEQSCVATQTGFDVMVTSRIVKVGPVEPAELTERIKANYAADHFTVKINTRGDEMDGLFKSYGQAPVKFRKRLELIG